MCALNEAYRCVYAGANLGRVWCVCRQCITHICYGRDQLMRAVLCCADDVSIAGYTRCLYMRIQTENVR